MTTTQQTALHLAARHLVEALRALDNARAHLSNMVGWLEREG